VGHREFVTTKRKLLIGAGAFIFVCVVVLALLPNPENRRLHARARIKWKDQAIVDVMTRSNDRQSITNELAALWQESKHSDEGWWVGTNVLTMTNGEFLVYSDINAKEDGRIHDIFIARGSDSKWYYSTFHFCVRMMNARIDGAPGSIAEFGRTYFASEFDGQSDECLKKTWPQKR
jgi:hypothetical protein